MSHSKGTWDYDAESGEVTTDDRSGDWCVKDKRTLVCHVNPLDGVSNGQLIAAAPDLLEFAQAYADQFRGYQITNTGDAKHDATGWLMGLARAVIAKAEA